MNVKNPVVVVTGASSGTGAAAARQLRSGGAEVVVVGRDPTRTHTLADELGVRGVTADFTSLASVRRLAEDLLAVNPRIDVLLDNAGAAVPASRPTVDGNEPNYQVNALAPFLLITLLTPALEQGGGRVVTTTSETHRKARLSANGVSAELDDTEPGVMGRYARGKLAALVLHREHARHHPGLVMAAVHPGLVASGFFRSMAPWGRLFMALARPLLVSPQTAAGRLVRVATTPTKSQAATTREPPRPGLTAGRRRPAGPSRLGRRPAAPDPREDTMTDPTTRKPAIDPGDPPDPRRLNRRDALVAGGGALGLFAVGFGVFGSKFVFPHPLVYPLADSATHSPGRCRRPRPRATTTRPTSTKRDRFARPTLRRRPTFGFPDTAAGTFCCGAWSSIPRGSASRARCWTSGRPTRTAPTTMWATATAATNTPDRTGPTSCGR